MEIRRSRGSEDTELHINRELVEYLGQRLPSYQWLQGLMKGGERPDRDGTRPGKPPRL